MRLPSAREFTRSMLWPPRRENKAMKCTTRKMQRVTSFCLQRQLMHVLMHIIKERGAIFVASLTTLFYTLARSAPYD